MQRALQTRRQRLRRLRELQNGTAGKAFAGIASLFLMLGIVLMAAATAVVFSFYRGYTEELPEDPFAVFAKQSLGPAQIFDRHGTLLYEFEDENEGLRNPVPLRDISQWAIKATIATEDNSYYDNVGINVRGLARAAYENVTDDDGLFQGSGGSSITQQLVKNVFIPEDQRYQRTADRKAKEAALAVELTRRYSKDQILEWYLNTIQYGNRTSGIEAAARRYFGVHSAELTLAQAALLAGLPQAPAQYDPFRNLDWAIWRQHEVLDLMVRNGHITEVEAQAAKEEPLVFKQNKTELLAPHWVFYVRDLLVARFGEETFKSGGLRVTTTLDLEVNNRAEQILRQKITEYEGPPYLCECHNGSIVAIDNKTGEILVMVGSRDYYRIDIEGENNNAIAIKQPGSAFKPIVYLASFLKGWNPGTIVYDQPTRFFWKIGDRGQREYFTPTGPNRVWHGAQSVRTSLGSSLNTAANKAAGFAGVDFVIDTAHKMGISTMDDKENYGVSISTGGANLTLLDLTFAYSVLSNNGEMRGTPAIGPRPGVAPNPDHRKVDPAALLRVEDINGKVYYEFNREQPARDQVVPAPYAYMITDILKDNDAKRLTYTSPEYLFSVGDNRPTAAKTGTQQGLVNNADVQYTWNIGYVPDLTVGVWVGNQDNKPVNRNLTSASSSALVWKEFMTFAVRHYGIPPKDWPVPPGLKKTTVNGRQEWVTEAQRNPICAEDLKQWTQDPQARNPSAPTNGGPFISPDCKPGSGSLCWEVREIDSRTGREVVRTECATGQTQQGNPATGTQQQPQSQPGGFAPVPRVQPAPAAPAPAAAPSVQGTPFPTLAPAPAIPQRQPAPPPPPASDETDDPAPAPPPAPPRVVPQAVPQPAPAPAPAAPPSAPQSVIILPPPPPPPIQLVPAPPPAAPQPQPPTAPTGNVPRG
jgi:membrane peptidoglycan carboxypeptidase